MRVFAITKTLSQFIFEEQFLSQTCFFAHICSDTHIVFSSVSICFSRKLKTSFGSSITSSFDFGNDAVVVRWVAHHSHVFVVFSRTTQHRRTTYVDIFDSIFHSHVRFSNSLTEWIEVNAHHVDEVDFVLFQCFEVTWVIATSEKATVHFWVESFHTTVTDFREPCHFADVNHFDIVVLEEFHCTASSDNIPTKFFKTLDKRHKTCFVAYTY